MALIFEPFFSNSMWITNAALVYYFGNANFERKLERSVLAAPRFAKQRIIDPSVYIFRAVIGTIISFYNNVVWFIMATPFVLMRTPSALLNYLNYWDARFVLVMRWLTLT